MTAPKRSTYDPWIVPLTLQDIAREAAKHGMAVVPDEPTDAMLNAAFADMNATPSGTWKKLKAAKISHRLLFASKMLPRYRAMIAAGRIKPE